MVAKLQSKLARPDIIAGASQQASEESKERLDRVLEKLGEIHDHLEAQG